MYYRVRNKREAEEAVAYLVNTYGASHYISEKTFMDGFSSYDYNGYITTQTSVTFGTKLRYFDYEYEIEEEETVVDWIEFRDTVDLFTILKKRNNLGDADLVESDVHDAVHKPSHYQLEDGTEVKDHIRSLLGDEGFKAYAIGNAIKYIGRYAGKGNPKQDLQKAQEYLDMVIEVLEGED